MVTISVLVFVFGLLLLVAMIVVIAIPVIRSLGGRLALKVPEDELDSVRMEVEATGPVAISFSTVRNFIGPVALSDAAVTWECHPGGLVVRPSSMHHFALRKADISRIEPRPVANQTTIHHSSAQVAAPIVINQPFESQEIQNMLQLVR